MPSLNKVLLMGNLTRDPELRVTPKGTPICQFSLAINRQFKMESGESREEVIYVDIEAWGKQGETIAKYCTKGRPLYVEGRLRLDQWEDKNTKEKRSRMKVVLEQFQFLGDSRGGGAGGAARAEAPGGEEPAGGASPERHAPPPRGGGAKPGSTENLDEDVPF
jgi:single-strand DNA-binding protein